MNADATNVPEGKFVLITNSNDPDDGKLYVKDSSTFNYLTTMSGATGINGSTPTIDQNGYWSIDGVSTGVKAQGDPGVTPSIVNGYWYIGATNTNVKATGDNGVTPSIDPSTKHWIIGSTDTGVVAEGVNGSDGHTPSISNGYWYINGTSTNIKAQGEDGATPLLRINSSTNYWEVSYDGGLTYTSLNVLATGPKGDAFQYSDFTQQQLEGLKGDQGIGIKSIAQTVTSTANGGVNTFTVTLDDDRTAQFNVRNGDSTDVDAYTKSEVDSAFV